MQSLAAHFWRISLCRGIIWYRSDCRLINSARISWEICMRRTLFTEEHRMFRDSFRHFVETEMVPNNEQWEKDGIVSRDLWLRAGQQGFLGINVPVEYGGSDID